LTLMPVGFGDRLRHFGKQAILLIKLVKTIG
jgi:hypothetical protein